MKNTYKKRKQILTNTYINNNKKQKQIKHLMILMNTMNNTSKSAPVQYSNINHRLFLVSYQS